MEEQEETKAWVVNQPEAMNRTMNAIYQKHKSTVEAFNKRIVEACDKIKTTVSYRTIDKEEFEHLSQFYRGLGFQIETEEIEKPDDTIIYKLKINW